MGKKRENGGGDVRTVGLAFWASMGMELVVDLGWGAGLPLLCVLALQPTDLPTKTSAPPLKVGCTSLNPRHVVGILSPCKDCSPGFVRQHDPSLLNFPLMGGFHRRSGPNIDSRILGSL